MMLIKWCETRQDKIIEWKFNKDDNSGARYGMIALGRSEDNKLVDCMYVMFKIDFKLAPKEWVIKNKRSALQNFFRLKVWKSFRRRGLLSQSSMSSLWRTPLIRLKIRQRWTENDNTFSGIPCHAGFNIVATLL